MEDMDQRSTDHANMTQDQLQARKEAIELSLRTATAWKRAALLRERTAIKEALSCSR